MAQAKRDGFRSRAAYKLIEIDDKHRFLKPGITVVDLGAAPGGWSQIAAKRVGAAEGKGKVIAIDLLEMPEIPGVSFARLDFLSEDAPDKLLAMIGGRADAVMSDMAANTTGHRKTDQLRILGLVEGAAAFAADVLNPGGTFLAKVFQSGADAELLAQLKRDFTSVRHVKPASSRQDSSERYVLAMGFRGQSVPAVRVKNRVDPTSERRSDSIETLAQPLIPGVRSRSPRSLPARLALRRRDDAGPRPETWWPASAGISKKKYADGVEMIATTMKAGAKQAGAELLDMVDPHRGFHAECADGDAGGNRQLLVDADQRGGAAHQLRLDFRIGERVDRGELQRTEEAADHQQDHDQEQRRRDREQRAGARGRPN